MVESVNGVALVRACVVQWQCRDTVSYDVWGLREVKMAGKLTKWREEQLAKAGDTKLR